MRAMGCALWIRLGALLVLALVFLAYLRPDFAVTIANQLWACF